MGVGDSLMAAGEARRLHKSNGLPTLILDRHGRPQADPIWKGVPYIIQRARGNPYNRIVNGPGLRPYIAGKTLNNWTWRKYKPLPAEIVFTDEERAFAEPFRGCVMIEPNVKNIGHDNKAWIASRWVEISLRRDDFVQCVPSTMDLVKVGSLNAQRIVTPTFRLAAAVLAVSKAFVGTEGGLMHAAAAVGTPAVILWSEFISPEITGYSTMANLRHAGRPCGNRMNCPGCKKSMEAISVVEVAQALEKLL